MQTCKLLHLWACHCCPIQLQAGSPVAPRAEAPGRFCGSSAQFAKMDPIMAPRLRPDTVPDTMRVVAESGRSSR